MTSQTSSSATSSYNTPHVVKKIKGFPLKTKSFSKYSNISKTQEGGAGGPSTIKITESKENTSIHRLDLSGLTGAGGGVGVAAAPLASYDYGCILKDKGTAKCLHHHHWFPSRWTLEKPVMASRNVGSCFRVESVCMLAFQPLQLVVFRETVSTTMVACDWCIKNLGCGPLC